MSCVPSAHEKSLPTCATAAISTSLRLRTILYCGDNFVISLWNIHLKMTTCLTGTSTSSAYRTQSLTKWKVMTPWARSLTVCKVTFSQGLTARLSKPATNSRRKKSGLKSRKNNFKFLRSDLFSGVRSNSDRLGSLKLSWPKKSACAKKWTTRFHKIYRVNKVVVNWLNGDQEAALFFESIRHTFTKINN